MANSESITSTSDSDESITKSHSDSDSITIKCGPKGDISWEVKAYGTIDPFTEDTGYGPNRNLGKHSADLFHKVVDMHDNLITRFKSRS